MNEYGTVVEIEDDTAKVKFLRTSACKNCRACGMLAGDTHIIIPVRNILNARIGDEVMIEITTGTALKASAFAYVFPLVMLVFGLTAGYFIGKALFQQINAEITAAGFGLILTVAAFFIIRYLEPQTKRRTKSIYRMVSIKNNGGEEQHGK